MRISSWSELCLPLGFSDIYWQRGAMAALWGCLSLGPPSAIPCASPLLPHLHMVLPYVCD